MSFLVLTDKAVDLRICQHRIGLQAHWTLSTDRPPVRTSGLPARLDVTA